MRKTILVDVDGVLLNWEYAFHIWLEEHGHEPVVIDQGLLYKISDQYGLDDDKTVKLIKHFNESAAIGFLPPLRDAMHYVKQLHEKHGYLFYAISSVSDDPNVAKLRGMNLTKLFGQTTFISIKCLPIGTSKYDFLTKFKNSGMYWIEDNIQNAEDGKKLGLKSLLFEHGFNMNYKGIPLVKNWEEVYNIITTEE